MAPLLKILVQWLPRLPSATKSPSHGPSVDIEPSFDKLVHQQQPIHHSSVSHGESPHIDFVSQYISALSRKKDTVDIFGLSENNLTHKFWDGHQWNPAGSKLEVLGNGLATPPVAISWGAERLDVFGLDDHATIKHQYYDGSSWQPDVGQLENLGGACDGKSTFAATSWGINRLDVFCRGPEGDLLHQFYDGYQWQPSSGSLESLGGTLSSGPSVVSWGAERIDIFAVDDNSRVAHLYWDGYQWSKWETFSTLVKFRPGSLTATSWGKGRLDVWVGDVDYKLWHLYYVEGSDWVWEPLSDVTDGILGSVSVTSWSVNRFDIVALGTSSQYLYKYFNGESWQPSPQGWYSKGQNEPFVSNPSIVSWGENRLDIQGVTIKGELMHQAWTGDSWYPGADQWESLGTFQVG